MGEHTHIGWSNGTWNPWYGCTKISPGCKFCYMYREMQRYGRNPFVVQRSKTTFDAPLKWKEPRMVFTCSWSDFFIEAADAWRPEAWEIIKRTPHLTYQILTKRPELISERLPADWGTGYPNVWLGVSVETHEFVWRLNVLENIPARIHFASLEPLLAPMFISSWLRNMRLNKPPLDWVIVGGESGSERECQVEWITAIVDDCRAAKTPVFVKQDSGPKAGQQGRIPDDYWVHEFPRMEPCESPVEKLRTEA